MRAVSELTQLAVIGERNSCFHKAESGQSLSCTSTTGVQALLVLQAALDEQLSVNLESGRSKYEVLSAQFSVPEHSPVLWFSFECWLGLPIPAPVTSLKLRQGADPNTTRFGFAGDHENTLRAGSIFSFPPERWTLTEIWGLGR